MKKGRNEWKTTRGRIYEVVTPGQNGEASGFRGYDAISRRRGHYFVFVYFMDYLPPCDCGCGSK